MFVFMIIAASAWALLPQYVHAEPEQITVSPEADEMGTRVRLSQGGWAPGTEVNLYAAFSPVGFEATQAMEYVTPLMRLTADQNGRWSTELSTDDIPDLLHRDRSEPGWVVFGAVAADIPRREQYDNKTSFVVTSNGQRPNGSGEIRVVMLSDLSFGGDEGAAIATRPVGSPFFRWRESVAIISNETIRGVPDGDWEVALRLPEDLNVSRSRSVSWLEAPVCYSASCPQASLVVQRVSIRDAGTVDVTFEIKEKAFYTGPGAESGRTALILGASALLVVLVAGVAALGYRRATG